MTGLTLPGIIELPGATAGRLISPKPALGPEAKRRISRAIFQTRVARACTCAWAMTRPSVAIMPSKRSSSVSMGLPHTSLKCCAMTCRKPGRQLIPVPTAVPPKHDLFQCSRSSFRRLTRRPVAWANAPNSWPSVSGTASCRHVLPILMTSANSVAFFCKEACRILLASMTFPSSS